MVERAMVNFALSDYLDKGKGDMPAKKADMMFKALHVEPEKFKEKMYQALENVKSTTNMMQMEPEQLADHLAKPSNLRQALTNDIHQGAEEVRIEKEQQNQREMQLANENQLQQQQQNREHQPPELAQPEQPHI